MKIIPSLASANQLCLEQELSRLGPQPEVHLDIEDGNFLPNITFGARTIRAVAALGRAQLDAHLMVTDPMGYLPLLTEVGMARACAQVEALGYPSLWLGTARRLGMQAGLALNIATPISVLSAFLHQMDYVLLMTAEPDGGDCLFNPASLGRIAEARALLPPDMELWVDGGVTAAHLPQLRALGVDVVIMGRAVFSQEDPCSFLSHNRR